MSSSPRIDCRARSLSLDKAFFLALSWFACASHSEAFSSPGSFRLLPTPLFISFALQKCQKPPNSLALFRRHPGPPQKRQIPGVSISSPPNHRFTGIQALFSVKLSAVEIFAPFLKHQTVLFANINRAIHDVNVQIYYVNRSKFNNQAFSVVQEVEPVYLTGKDRQCCDPCDHRGIRPPLLSGKHYLPILGGGLRHQVPFLRKVPQRQIH